MASKYRSELVRNNQYIEPQDQRPPQPEVFDPNQKKSWLGNATSGYDLGNQLQGFGWGMLDNMAFGAIPDKFYVNPSNYTSSQIGKTAGFVTGGALGAAEILAAKQLAKAGGGVIKELGNHYKPTKEFPKVLSSINNYAGTYPKAIINLFKKAKMNKVKNIQNTNSAINEQSAKRVASILNGKMKPLDDIVLSSQNADEVAAATKQLDRLKIARPVATNTIMKKTNRADILRVAKQLGVTSKDIAVPAKETLGFKDYAPAVSDVLATGDRIRDYVSSFTNKKKFLKSYKPEWQLNNEKSFNSGYNSVISQPAVPQEMPKRKK